MLNQFLLSPFSLDARDTRIDRLATPGCLVNAPTLQGDDTMTRLGAVHVGLADLVARAVADGRRPVSIGGDCCQTIAVMAGLRRAGVAPVLVWLDAHGDFNTRESSITGYLGGMPLAMLVGRGDQKLLQQLALEPIVESDVVLSDARDLDPDEAVNLHGSAVAHVRQVDDLMARIPQTRPIYVHFDVDILDANETPAMSYPVKGGPSVAQMTALAHRLRETSRLAAVSVTPWALDHPERDRTERACLAVLDALTSDG